MTTEEVQKITEMRNNFATAAEIAAVFGCHPQTLIRRLLKENEIVLERVSACQLTPLNEYRQRHQSRKSTTQ